jgi:hypothetical protein
MTAVERMWHMQDSLRSSEARSPSSPRTPAPDNQSTTLEPTKSTPNQVEENNSTPKLAEKIRENPPKRTVEEPP